MYNKWLKYQFFFPIQHIFSFLFDPLKINKNALGNYLYLIYYYKYYFYKQQD